MENQPKNKQSFKESLQQNLALVGTTDLISVRNSQKPNLKKTIKKSSENPYHQKCKITSQSNISNQKGVRPYVSESSKGASSTQHTKPKTKCSSSGGGNVQMKKLCSKSSLKIFLKKYRLKANKELSLFVRCTWRDIKLLKDDVRKIEVVYENRTKKDIASKMKNLEILQKLHGLVSCVGLRVKIQEKIIHYITRYLCSNIYLLTDLVYIIADTEDFQTCLYTIKILHQILIKGHIFDHRDRSAIKRTLSSVSMMGTLIDSMYFVHMKFCVNSKYKEEVQNVHSMLLQLIVTLCNKNNRKLLRSANEATVRLVGKLTVICRKNKDLAINVLEVLKVICIKKKNCDILACKKFFDGLCHCYKLTQKMLTVPMILKKMSRHKLSLGFMSGNEKVFNLILELIHYNGKRLINKRVLITTLFRITKHENGLKILSKNEIFYKLFHYFLKNEKSKVLSYRMGIIKVYTILNRSVNRITLPNIELDRDLYLPDDVKKYLEEENVSEESEPENDESEDDSQDDDDSDEVDCNMESKDASKKPSTENTKPQDILEESLTDMFPFFTEYLLTAGDTGHANTSKFSIYESLIQLPKVTVIENRVHRGGNIGNHAYPDAAMLEMESDEDILNPLINNFSVQSLTYKLKCSKGVYEHKYIPRVVYDLDQLHKNCRRPTEIPHPSTFIPKKSSGQTLTNINEVNSLKFESRFECGNLRKAVQVETYEYELQINPDTSTTKGLHWFYFQVSNMITGVSYTFNIINFLKFNSQYNHGMQPLMFSVTDHALNKTGWKRVGEKIVYYGNNCFDESGAKQYRTLSFSVSFQYADDYVYFAYHYPYTYTRLMTRLLCLINFKSNEIYARMDKLCDTVTTKNEIALLTITGAWGRTDTLGIPLRRRPIVFITARVHSGETNSSWIMEGIINFLLDENDAHAIRAREYFIFKVIPMLNPEGVIYGNSRNGLTGVDLNRCWARPNKVTCPEIYYSKRLIACAKKELQLPVAAYIDIHGHSGKKFFFFYGCNPKMSWNKSDKSGGDAFDILKLLPEMVHGLNPNIRLGQCKYKVEKSREKTGRVVMWRQFDIKHSYTLECSYSFGSNKKSVNTQILADIGSSVIASLGKIADRTYLSRRSLSSFSLDYSQIDVCRANEKRNSLTGYSKSEQEDAKLLLTLSRSMSNTIEDSSQAPLFVDSRVLENAEPSKDT